MQERVKAKAIELLESGVRVLGWKAGEFFYDVTPAVFTSREEIEKEFVFGPFCGANMSKYLIAESRKEGRVGVFLKPCDTYSFQQLQKEQSSSLPQRVYNCFICVGFLLFLLYFLFCSSFFYSI